MKKVIGTSALIIGATEAQYGGFSTNEDKIEMSTDV